MTVPSARQWTADHPGTEWEPGMPRPSRAAAGRAYRSLGVGEVTPWVRAVVVGCYARTGQHCETAALLWPDGVPARVQDEAELARAAWLRGGEP